MSSSRNSQSGQSPNSISAAEQIVRLDFASGLLSGPSLTTKIVRLSDLVHVFRDEEAWCRMSPETLIYTVRSFQPVVEGSEGGLFWGTTVIEPGEVGDEYFMTRGHFHAKRGRGEFYTTLCGYGALILMGENQQTYSQQMRRGTVHYIAGGIAHRVANTGTERLIFCACWPSDAGHDYESISATGFSSRLCNRGEAPTLLRTD